MRPSSETHLLLEHRSTQSDVREFPNQTSKMQRNDLRPVLGSLAENTAMHGLPNIKRSLTWARRGFWTIIVLAGLVMIIYEVAAATIKYYSYPVQTNISPETAFSHPFPAVTICNQNPIRTSAASRAASISSLLNSTKTGTASARVSLRNTIMKLYTEVPEDVKVILGHQMDTMLLDCSHDGTECNATDFVLFSNYFYGNCFTYNSGHTGEEVHKASNVGPLYSLQLALYIEQNEYVGQLAETAGIRVVIHNRTHMPFPEDEGFSAAPGTLTYVGLSRREIKRAEPPYGTCQTNLHGITNAYTDVLSSVEYSKLACRKTCLQYFVMKVCGCGDPTLLLNSTAYTELNLAGAAAPCINTTQVACNDQVRDEYERNKLNCSSMCSSQCFEVKHKTSLSYGTWPADNAEEDVYALLRSNPVSAKQIRGLTNADLETFLNKNTLKIMIYFESLDYDYVSTSSSYSSSDLAASFGGQMGLWLGVSVCTLFEVIEMFWDMFLVCQLKMGSKNKTQQSEDNNSDKNKINSNEFSMSY